MKLLNKIKQLLKIKPNSISSKCDHGVYFDASKAQKMSIAEIRKLYPRLEGDCPKGCGYKGIAYASMSHCICGDW